MKRPAGTRARAVPRERRIDVTRVEYEHLLALVQRNAEAIRRLQLSDEIQLRRTGELQASLDELKGSLKLHRQP